MSIRRARLRKIGLLGGSFDPPHEGHLRISTEALKAFDLDEVWWLVTPHNPLKPRGPAPIEDRMQAARAMISHPAIKVTDIEQHLGTRYTADTLRALIARRRDCQFVWLMGADNMRQISQWQDWQDIFHMVPVGVLARPGLRLRALRSKAARLFAKGRLNRSNSHNLPIAPLPAWCFVNIPMVNLSSTELRNKTKSQ